VRANLGVIAGDSVRLNYADTILSDRRKRRGSYSKAFKRRVVSETMEPGASVAAVARRHSLNANMVFLWRRDPRFGPGKDAASFLPVEVTATEVAAPPEPAEPAPAEPTPVDPTCESRIEIALTSGHRLRLSGAFDVDLVLRLARGLVTL
jgi:transposase